LGLYLLLSENTFITGEKNSERLIDKIHFEVEHACSAQPPNDKEKEELLEQLDKLSHDCLFLKREDKIFKIQCWKKLEK